jgi:hypothetical protein
VQSTRGLPTRFQVLDLIRTQNLQQQQQHMQQAQQQQAFGLPAAMNRVVGMPGMHEQPGAHNFQLPQFAKQLNPAQLQALVRDPNILQTIQNQPGFSRQIDMMHMQSQQQNQQPNPYRQFQQQQQHLQQHQQQHMQAAMGNQMGTNLTQNGFLSSVAMAQIPDGLQPTLATSRGPMQPTLPMAQRQDSQSHNIFNEVSQRMSIIQTRLNELNQEEAMAANGRIGKPEHIYQAKVNTIRSERVKLTENMNKLQALMRAHPRPTGHM